jgi:hypothetical protein
MIVAGIGSAAVQLAKGVAMAPLAQASPAAAQAVDAPRIENAKLETRAVGPSLDRTLREIAVTAERMEWVGYHVDEVAGETWRLLQQQLEWWKLRDLPVGKGKPRSKRRVTR